VKIYNLIKTSFLLIRPDLLFLAMGLLLFGSLISFTNIYNTVLFILLGAVGLFGAAGSLDEYGDYDLDIKNKNNRFLSSLYNAKISKKHALTQATLLYSFANLGLYFFFGIYALVVGLFLTAVTILYSFSVFNLKERGAPRLLTNVLSLTLLFMLPAVAQNTLNVTIFLWASVIFLSLLAAVLCNDLKDFPIEKKEGMKTLSVTLGLRKLSTITLFLSFSALIMLLVHIFIGAIGEKYVLAILTSLAVKSYYVRFLLKPAKPYLRKIAFGGVFDLTFMLFFLSFLTLFTY